MRLLILSALLVGGSVEFACGESLAPPKGTHIASGEPCRVDTTTNNAGPVAPIRIGRRSALYIIRHIHKACQILTDLRDDSSRADTIRGQLYNNVLSPIYRAHPNILGELAQLPPKAIRATPRDIRRSDAVQFDETITRLQNDIAKLGNDKLNEAADEDAAKKVQEHFIDATTELLFAIKIGYDAYPDLFARRMNAVVVRPRTTESDTAFRKGAPPLGAVKLSDAAFALIQGFMREVRRATGEDEIAAITRARQQSSKGPEDTAWSDKGPGWSLGAYRKSQVPPDVIDTVRGIKIVFTAEDPAALTGKTFDATNHQLFVRD